jgi:ABC-2 type transport system ATP-binding protein
MSRDSFIEVEKVKHSYGTRVALNDVSFSVRQGEIFGLLGPNGGGKTTLFRILSTLIPLQQGNVSIAGSNLDNDLAGVRSKIGVVFQSPSLDKKLTVLENLRHQGHLYGLKGSALEERMDFLMEKLKLKDRAQEWVEKLSGGLQRRVEVAKGLLHRPPILLLDEPSTGLDPNARRDLWNYLAELKKEEGVTILVTTHLMEEAERCDRLMILDQGTKVALDTPSALRAIIGGTVITAQSSDPAKLEEFLKTRFNKKPIILSDRVRVEWTSANEKIGSHEVVGQILQAFPKEVESITVSQPSLEDVFIHLTGKRFSSEVEKN